VLVARQAAELSSASALRESEGPDESGLEGLLGESQAIRAIFGKIEQLAEYDSLVLITGESGTGKELAAEAIHRGSRRAAGPLVKVNCAALSETLLESELFGHVRGSFTGAVRDKVGRFQAAEGGSLFLDEIGDMSPQIQLKLLRFLEQYEYERVGESTTRQADVRIIAATNADLQAKVRDGLFREDLFYRIKVVGLHMPPLRERVGDVPLLAAHFLRRYAPPGQGEPRISKEVMEFLVRHQWPGNVRELRHAMEHASVMSRGEAVELRHLPDELREVTPPRQHGGGSGVGPEDIFEALRASDFNKARAAKLLGISRVTLYRKLERHADLRRRIEALSRKR
jgi:transcriptional regulator with PAS, ATPase and Fis domain